MGFILTCFTGVPKNLSNDDKAMFWCSSLSQSTALSSLTVNTSPPLTSVLFTAGSLAETRIYNGLSLNAVAGVRKINARINPQITSYWAEPLSNDHSRNRFICELKCQQPPAQQTRCHGRPGRRAFQSAGRRKRR